MRRTTIFLLIIFTVFTVLQGQTLENIKLDNKLSVLNDRAFFYFPTEAKNEMRGVDIMSADPNANEETRIVFDNGEMRLIFFAQELFILSDKELLDTITKQNESDQSKTKILTDKDSLQSILSTPTKFDTTQNVILVNSLIVKTQDNTIFRISAYVNSSAYKLIDQFQKLSESTFSTLSMGTRMNNRAARQEKLSIFGTDKNFAFSLPENYSITVDQQYDFQVFKFHKYHCISDTNWVQLIIYNGQHPSMVYRDYELSEKDGQKISGKFLDKKVDWLLFDISSKGFFDKEQKIICNNIEKGLIVHIAMLSNQQNALDDLTKIIETMQLIK